MVGLVHLLPNSVKRQQGKHPMDTASPTREQRNKFEYEPPAYDQKVIRQAWRKKTAFERIKALEPEHRQAVTKLEIHFYGAQGVDVRWDDDIPADRNDVPDEFAIHRHAGLLEDAKKAVGSPRVWKALTCQILGTLTPQDIGHQWGEKKDRNAAKAYGEALIIAGLDTLCMHWGLISKPP